MPITTTWMRSRTIGISRRLACSSALLRAKNISLRMAISVFSALNCAFNFAIFSSKSSAGASAIDVSSLTTFSRVISSSSSWSSRMTRRGRPSVCRFWICCIRLVCLDLTVASSAANSSLREGVLFSLFVSCATIFWEMRSKISSE
ncbi:hypothetical protein [Bradyrhizobium lupini]|uniref:hypothetical protein n=1 Tax=Rhizobium lupini TaxID=136996 RepID=UPI00387E06F9